jgi:copper resistance protein B
MDTSTGHSDHPATGMDMDTGHSDHPDMDTGTGMAGHDMGADPLLLMLNVHELELREHSGSDVLNWDMDAWYGADLHKVWLKTEGEARRGSVAEQEWQLLYRRAASAFGDWQLGVRHDSGEVADQDWLALGWVGTLPYQVHMDTAAFAGEAGQTALRIKLEQEWLLSQRWALSPSLELNLHGHTDRQRQIGSGLSSTDAGLRLKYRAGLKLHHYIGVTYGRYSGTTADFMAAAGEQREQWQGVLGVSFWY